MASPKFVHLLVQGTRVRYISAYFFPVLLRAERASTAKTPSTSTPTCKSGRRHRKSLLRRQRQSTSLFHQHYQQTRYGCPPESDEDSLRGNGSTLTLVFDKVLSKCRGKVRLRIASKKVFVNIQLFVCQKHPKSKHFMHQIS